MFMRQGLQFLISIILARILSPNDFGVVAMLALFVGVASIFIDSGFSAALIQRQNTTHTDESTVFFFNIGMGFLAALLLSIAAFWIAAFFNEPTLQYLTYAMSFNLFVNSFGSIHNTMLIKEMNFKTIAKAGIVSSSTAGMLAIFLAFRGYGVWSLAVQSITTSIISVLLLWYWHSWRPKWTFSLISLRSFFRFGGYEMAATLIDVFSNNLYLILIGKIYSPSDVGYYDRAQRTQQLPITLMMNITNRVFFSVFSTLSNDKPKLIKGLRKAQAVAMFVNIPLMVGVILLAEPLILTLFGPQWLPCVPVLQVLGIGGFLWPLHVLNLNILKAQGYSDLFFRITILKKVVSISLTIAASYYGVIAIAWAQVATSIIAYFVNTYYTKVFLSYSGLKQLGDLAANFISVLPMAISLYFLTNLMQEASYCVKLISASVLGGLIYLVTCRLLCSEIINEFLYIIKERKHVPQM